MTKLHILLCLALSLFSMTACGSESTEPIEPEIPKTSETENEASGKTLIVFFSWGGNTRAVANHIHDITGGDINRG